MIVKHAGSEVALTRETDRKKPNTAINPTIGRRASDGVPSVAGAPRPTRAVMSIGANRVRYPSRRPCGARSSREDGGGVGGCLTARRGELARKGPDSQDIAAAATTATARNSAPGH